MSLHLHQQHYRMLLHVFCPPETTKLATNMRNYTNENFLKIMHLKQKTNKQKTAFDIKGKLFIQD